MRCFIVNWIRRFLALLTLYWFFIYQPYTNLNWHELRARTLATDKLTQGGRAGRDMTFADFQYSIVTSIISLFGFAIKFHKLSYVNMFLWGTCKVRRMLKLWRNVNFWKLWRKYHIFLKNLLIFDLLNGTYHKNTECFFYLFRGLSLGSGKRLVESIQVPTYSQLLLTFKKKNNNSFNI